jgi:hypothetical protein
MVSLTLSSHAFRSLLAIVAETHTVVATSKETTPVVLMKIYREGKLELEFDALIGESDETS